MNERQIDLIFGIIWDELEGLLSLELASAVCKEICEGIRKNKELIEQLGATGKYTEKEGAGRHETKQGQKMENGCLVSPRELIRILLVKQENGEI